MNAANVTSMAVSLASLLGAGLMYLGARRANRNVSQANLQTWADNLLGKVQLLQNEIDDLRAEAQQITNQLRLCQQENLDVRRQAMREDDMFRFREWLYDPQRRTT